MTVEPASEVPRNVGWLSFVTLSVFEIPWSLIGSRSPVKTIGISLTITGTVPTANSPSPGVPMAMRAV